MPTKKPIHKRSSIRTADFSKAYQGAVSEPSLQELATCGIATKETEMIIGGDLELAVSENYPTAGQMIINLQNRSLLGMILRKLEDGIGVREVE